MFQEFVRVLCKMDFKKIQKLCYDEYIRNGYYEMWSHVKPHRIGLIAELGLINTEIAEAIENIRDKFTYDELFEELADVIIRTMNIATRLNFEYEISNQLEEAIIIKNKENLKRGLLHGKVI